MSTRRPLDPHVIAREEHLPLFPSLGAAPSAANSEHWEARVIGLAYDLAARCGALTPSALREAAECRGLVAHHPDCWGAIWTRLRGLGWHHTELAAVNSTASRNSPSESVWRRP